MHIVEIPSFFPPYGGEFCLEQARALKARGHEVRVVSNVQLSIKRSISEYLYTLPYGRSWQEIDGVEVFQSFQRGLPMVIRPNVRRWVGIVQLMFHEYVERHGRPDVIHAHCVKWAGYAAMLIAKAYAIPYVITEHLPAMTYSQEFGEPSNNLWQTPLLRQALKYASMVITVSEELKDDLAPYFGKDYQSTHISNLIDVAFFKYKLRVRQAEAPFRFCCLAINDERKGYDILLQAFRKTDNCELHIAGNGTDDAGFLEMVRRERVDGRVIIHGALNKEGVRELLYQSDALVLATRSESQGLVLLEAMSTGIPVISTRAIPESVRIPQYGWFVPTDDAEALANAMSEVVQLKDFDGAKASRCVSELASPSVIGRKIEQVLRSAIAAGT